MGPLGITRGPNDEKVPGEHFAAGLKGGLKTGQKAQPKEEERTASASAAPQGPPTPTIMNFDNFDLDDMMKNSVSGSRPFSKRELRQGYRKLGKGH